MQAIYGLFADRDSARRALAALSAESARLRLQPENLVVISAEPLEEEGFGWQAQRTRMPWLSMFGGIFGGTAGYALASFTQRSYPLPTGGMPIVAMWPTGIVVYELTMLGAIVTTIVSFLLSSGLPHRSNRLYDPEVTNGKILVGVPHPDRACLADIERRLYQEGAVQVKPFPAAPPNA
ncbi:MAG TPA: quinol:electron acceptor oxidoreductase subunit ActD [Terriglobales bacterium]|nr:quinol:electron acceptor oxidoreductase subunit ActD [Terriglobales bacterium]